MLTTTRGRAESPRAKEWAATRLTPAGHRLSRTPFVREYSASTPSATATMDSCAYFSPSLINR